jgi:hypothetical protein
MITALNKSPLFSAVSTSIGIPLNI